MINRADTAWMLTATALVLLMTLPALALFYGGLVQAKNMLVGLRMDREHETLGLDLSAHGETGYHRNR
ncbi:MAG TPA: hypothetical protein VMO78_14060 [Rhizomicrobium sp.]|nr:hypothetical protein [Rhizomicrobium sp.]